MAVRDVMTFKVKPGRAPDVAALHNEGLEIEKKVGLPTHRMFATAVGGEAWLSRTVVVEYDDMKAWAESTAKQQGSAEWQAFLPRLFGADAPWTPVSRVLVNELGV
jgi:hypothetical protein